MILLLKNSIIRRGLLFRPPSFCFASSFNQHTECNKAKLAFQIINTIKDSPLNQYCSDKPYPSLREKILQLIDNYVIDVNSVPQQETITLKVKQSLKKYFVDGVWVPGDMCSQERFDPQQVAYSQLQKSKQEVQIFVDQETIDQNLLFNKLQFCPTYFVTGQIFRRILKLQDIRFLTGQYGVGKTYSSILYTLLSEIIFRYRHKYFPDSNIFQWQFGHFKQIPKAFYWCVNKKSRHHKPTVMNEIINRHFYQLKGMKQYSGDIMTHMQQLPISKLLFNKFCISTVLLVDQISELASMLRNHLNSKSDVRRVQKEMASRAHQSIYQLEEKLHYKLSFFCKNKKKYLCNKFSQFLEFLSQFQNKVVNNTQIINFSRVLSELYKLCRRTRLTTSKYLKVCFYSHFIVNGIKNNRKFLIIKQMIVKNLNSYFIPTRKYIDFVVCQMIKTQQTSSLQINVFDPTINEEASIVKKIRGFFRQLANFKDKYDSVSINGQYFPVFLNYIVLTTANTNSFNCKSMIISQITDYEKKFKQMMSSGKVSKEKIKKAQENLAVMKEFKLKDYGNSCQVTLNQNYKSQKPVVVTFSVVSVSKQMKISCENYKAVQIQMMLLKKIEPNMQIKSIQKL